jgi:hypothetical protein
MKKNMQLQRFMHFSGHNRCLCFEEAVALSTTDC